MPVTRTPRCSDTSFSNPGSLCFPICAEERDDIPVVVQTLHRAIRWEYRVPPVRGACSAGQEECRIASRLGVRGETQERGHLNSMLGTEQGSYDKGMGKSRPCRGHGMVNGSGDARAGVW